MFHPLIITDETAWRKFCAEATPDEIEAAYVALLEIIDGELGEKIRTAYKLRGPRGVSEILERRHA